MSTVRGLSPVGPPDASQGERSCRYLTFVTVLRWQNLNNGFRDVTPRGIAAKVRLGASGSLGCNAHAGSEINRGIHRWIGSGRIILLRHAVQLSRASGIEEFLGDQKDSG
jgi:hypothetical protein